MLVCVARLKPQRHAACMPHACGCIWRTMLKTFVRYMHINTHCTTLRHMHINTHCTAVRYMHINTHSTTTGKQHKPTIAAAGHTAPSQLAHGAYG
jgi:hypothetical protein